MIRKKDFEDSKINCQLNNIKCQICYDTDIDTLIIPCGHTFCRKCIENSKNVIIVEPRLINPKK